MRRFYCEAAHCRRRIFAERFDESVLDERSRRTARLDHIVHRLGLALGGRPAASFARRLLLRVIVAAIEARAPTLVEARLLIDRFQEMIRKKAECDLDPWITEAHQSLIASFARGVVNDLAAVRAAISRQKGRSPS